MHIFLFHVLAKCCKLEFLFVLSLPKECKLKNTMESQACIMYSGNNSVSVVHTFDY